MYPEKSMIDNRIKYLEHIIEDKQQSLLKAPEGKIRIVKIRSHPHYYWRKDPKEITGSYIREKDRALAKKLAQKSYDLEIVTFAQKEKEILQKLQKRIQRRCSRVLYCPRRTRTIQIRNHYRGYSEPDEYTVPI